MEHFGYLAAAYSIIFVVIFGYVVFMRGRQRRVEEELRMLERKIETLGAGGAPSVAGGGQRRS